MNKCLNCNKQVKNKYCNVTCQNKHQNTNKMNKKYGEFKDFEVSCNTCNTKFIVNERENLHPKKDKYYCSRSCANKRLHNEKTKRKISETLTKGPQINIVCVKCGLELTLPNNRRGQKYCSRSCSIKHRNETEDLCRKAGKVSSKKQSTTRRSKNEIYFSELCKETFNTVLTNEPMFNGWDADVIIEDYKIAVLWNGRWHYEKITESHSVEQVKNRDKIKIKEIKNAGYTPYIIKDMGKHDKEFVNKKFHTFLLDMEFSCGG